jgi:hypothetical protein
VTIGSSLLPLITAIGINFPAAAGQATPITIDFDAPAGCSSIDAFYQGVRVRTDRVRPTILGEIGLLIRVRLFRVGKTIRGELTFGDQQEESETRRVDGLSCNEVVEALSLTAALALDPSASLLTGRNASQAGLGTDDLAYSEKHAAPAPLASAPASQADSRAFLSGGSGLDHADPESGKHVDVFARAMMGTYVTPGLDFGAEMGARLIFPLRGRLRASIGLQGLYASNDILVNAVSSRFRLAGAMMTLCPVQHVLVRWFEIGACGFAAGGWLDARGIGVSHPQTVGRTWWMLGLSSLASMRIFGPWRLELSAGLAFPLLEREFRTTWPDRYVGKTPIPSLQVGLGIAYRF